MSTERERKRKLDGFLEHEGILLAMDGRSSRELRARNATPVPTSTFHVIVLVSFCVEFCVESLFVLFD